MAIRIIKEPDIYITESEMEALRPEYEAAQTYTTRPQSFESWLRRRKMKPTEREEAQKR